MLVNTDKINARLLFIISFSVTALAICVFKFPFSVPLLHVHHSFWQNVLFINITFLGSSIFCFGLIVFLLYKKQYALAWIITGSTLISLFLIQVIKNYLHKDGVQIFFEDEQYFFNQGEKDIQFVSSHIALAFSLVTILALYFNNKLKTIFLFFIAFVVVYSRIYLDHHTLPELFAGAFIGVAFGSLSFYCNLNYKKLKKPELQKQKEYNHSIPITNFLIE